MTRLAWCTALLVLAASSAHAQNNPDSLRAWARAEIAQGHFESALNLFRAASRHATDPRVWLEVGDAADRLRRDDIALEAYERYLVVAPDATDRAEIHARVAVLRSVLAGRPARAEEPDRPGFIPAAVIVEALQRGPRPAGLGRQLSRP
jgi:Flp pilus assembly protein TadD